MDIQTFLHNLHEEVSCSVCMTKFTDPKQLPCLHSFCLHCLQKIQETSGIRETISCPECRRTFRIPGSGDLNALPTNFRINSLLDVLAIKECNTSGVKCGNCDRKSGDSSYCFQCCSFWCDDCLPLHNGIRANKEHHALALKDFQDEDFDNILKRPAFCQQKHHEQEELKFFCKKCELIICNTCALTDHEGHSKMLLELAANERKLRVKSAIETHKQRAQKQMNKIEKLKESCVKVQEEATRVKRDVQQFADRIITAIEANKIEIFEDVENKVKEFFERVEMKRQEIEEKASMHETVIEKIEKFLKRSTSSQIMQPNEFLDRLLQDQGDQMQDDRVDLERDIFPVEFHFKENQQMFDNSSAEKIGFVHMKMTKTCVQQSNVNGKGIREATVGLQAELVVTTRNTLEEQCYEECDFVTVEIRNRQGHDCATIEQLQDNKDGTYKISYFAKETGTCQTSVKVNGEHVHGSPFEVQVQPRQYKPMVSFGQQGSADGRFNRPWGVAVNEKNEIAVTEVGNHRIQIFNSDGRLLRSIGGKGSQQGELNWPAGISYHNDNIIVVDCVNHRVQLFTDQGEYVNQFGGEGSGRLKFPYGLSLDSDGNIIVADKDNKLIKIFSPDGTLLHKFGTEGSLIYPLHCIQHNNYLVVSDYGDHSVKVFNREGKFLYSFGKRGNGNGEFEYPGCLSMNKADQLMVCDRKNCRIQVLELNGTFVTAFGQKGSEPGKFNTPISTVVLNDGRIVVSDFGNKRIQIFE